jgi:hypothetical protein
MALWSKTVVGGEWERGHRISWDATGSEDASLDLRVVEEGAQNEDEYRHACKAGAGSRLGAADVPGRGGRNLRLFDPLHDDKENTHSEQARVRKPAERILHCDEASVPENNHACVKRCAKSCKTRTMDGHSRPTHDVDTDWDKLKQPTCEGDIGRCPILCHEEDKHHDKKSDNEPWLPVRNRRKNLGGRHVLGVPWATVIQWSTFIGNTAAGISIFFAFYSKVSRVFFAFSYKWKLFFIFIIHFSHTFLKTMTERVQLQPHAKLLAIQTEACPAVRSTQPANVLHALLYTIHTVSRWKRRCNCLD